jgi:small subunit ribosomal protein S6
MMRKYEAAFIFSGTLDDSALEAEITKIEELVKREGGSVKDWNRWGKRRLAYEIAGQSDGYYAFLEFEVEPAALDTLARTYRLNENILRHMHTVKED